MRLFTLALFFALTTSLALAQSQDQQTTPVDPKIQADSAGPKTDGRQPTASSFTDEELDHPAEITTCYSIRAYMFDSPKSPAAKPKPTGMTDCVAQSKREMKRVDEPAQIQPVLVR